MTRLYFPGDIADHGECHVTGGQAHHVLHVLRLEAGAPLTLFDGRGGEGLDGLDPGQRFGAAEKRELEQVVFPDEKAAADALAKVKAGTSLADVAKESNLQVADLGTVAKSDLFDKAIADAGDKSISPAMITSVRMSASRESSAVKVKLSRM